MNAAKREYTSEHHDWDLTMRASSDLLTFGEKTEQRSFSFAGLVGSMLLAVSALESFLNSLAYKVSEKDGSFPWKTFEKKSLQSKLEDLLNYYSQAIDKGKRPWQTITKAVSWRNGLVHAKPTLVDPVAIDSTVDIRKLPKRYVANSQYEPYEALVTQEWAKKFNQDVIKLIELLIIVSGINPRAQCSYRILKNET